MNADDFTMLMLDLNCAIFENDKSAILSAAEAAAAADLLETQIVELRSTLVQMHTDMLTEDDIKRIIQSTGLPCSECLQANAVFRKQMGSTGASISDTELYKLIGSDTLIFFNADERSSVFASLSAVAIGLRSISAIKYVRDRMRYFLNADCLNTDCLYGDLK